MKNLGHVARVNGERPTLIIVIGITRAVEISLIAHSEEKFDSDAHRNLALGLNMGRYAYAKKAITLNQAYYTIFRLDPIGATL